MFVEAPAPAVTACRWCAAPAELVFVYPGGATYAYCGWPCRYGTIAGHLDIGAVFSIVVMPAPYDGGFPGEGEPIPALGGLHRLPGEYQVVDRDDTTVTIAAPDGTRASIPTATPLPNLPYRLPGAGPQRPPSWPEPAPPGWPDLLRGRASTWWRNVAEREWIINQPRFACGQPLPDGSEFGGCGAPADVMVELRGTNWAGEALLCQACTTTRTSKQEPGGRLEGVHARWDNATERWH